MIRYCPITRDDFRDMMTEMGFVEFIPEGTFEFVYERNILNRDKTISRFKLRIYSSVSIHDRVTRESGKDAIRVLIMDTVIDKSVQEWTVHRTKNALLNTRERARDAYRFALNADRCHCGALKVERKGKYGKFFSCSAFPICKG